MIGRKLAVSVMLVFGLALPRAALAKRPSVTLDEVPTLAAVVEREGWTVTPTQSGIYKPGTVLVPNARGAHNVVATGCVDADPQVEVMSQSSIAMSLSGGVQGHLGPGSAAAGAGITKQLTFVDPEQRTIPLGQIVVSDGCRRELETAARFEDLSQAVIVHDVLVAVIKSTVCKRVTASGTLVALGEAEATAYSDCVQESAGQVPVGFKGIALSKVYHPRPAQAPPALQSPAAPLPSSGGAGVRPRADAPAPAPVPARSRSGASAPAQPNAGTVVTVKMADQSHTHVELACPGGFRSRGSFVDGVVSISDVPSEECTVHFKGGVPAKYGPVSGGETLTCFVETTTAVCTR